MTAHLQSQISRRTLLETAGKTALALTAVAASPELFVGHAAAAADRRWQMRLSTSSSHFSSLSVEKACQQIADLGYEGVDFWDPVLGCPHLNEIEKRLGAAGLKDLLGKHNLKLFSLTCFGSSISSHAKLLGDLGGGVVVLGSPPLESKNLTADMKKLLEQMKPDLDLAEKSNAYLAIENHYDLLLDSFDSFKAFSDLNTNPRLGIALAPFHLQRAKISVERTIELLGKHLFFFYAWLYAEPRGTNQLPGIGTTNCRPWLQALAKIEYRGYVNPFMHDEPAPQEMAAALTTSRDYLKRCYNEAVRT
jgi:sugar phosphate isomerase/epimerase